MLGHAAHFSHCLGLQVEEKDRLQVSCVHNNSHINKHHRQMQENCKCGLNLSICRLYPEQINQNWGFNHTKYKL